MTTPLSSEGAWRKPSPVHWVTCDRTFSIRGPMAEDRRYWLIRDGEVLARTRTPLEAMQAAEAAR